jgi:hypothetical protein
MPSTRTWQSASTSSTPSSKSVRNAIKTAWDNAIKTVSGWWATVSGAVGDAAKKVAEAAQKVESWVKGAMGTISGWFGHVVQAIGDYATELYHKLHWDCTGHSEELGRRMADGVLQKVRLKLQEFWNHASGLMTGLSTVDKVKVVQAQWPRFRSALLGEIGNVKTGGITRVRTWAFRDSSKQANANRFTQAYESRVGGMGGELDSSYTRYTR